MSHFEVGFTKGNVVTVAWKAVKTIFCTWWFARKNELPRDKWYGVYYKGSETKIAEFGCLPAAEGNARIFVAALYAQTDNCSE